jgi:cytochrome c2
MMAGKAGASRRAHAATGAAVAALCLALLCHTAAAHEQDGPPLQVVFDKPMQHRAGIRTVRVSVGAERVELPAVVIADPRRQLRIAASQDGMIEPAGAALPRPGQAVQAGQLLAWLRPALPQPERRDLAVERSNAQRDIELGRLQIDRYGIDEHQRLEVKLPTPSIEIVTSYHSAQARDGELRGALEQPLPLRAPRAGIILRSPAAAGRIVPAGETLFELDAPGTLAVAAEYADDDLDAAAAEQGQAGGGVVHVHFLGAAADAGLRTRRALYAVDETAGLQVGQPVLLHVPRQPQGAVPALLPAAAVFHHDGRTWVWLHQQAERFVARPVDAQAVDDGRMRVAGLSSGERVVVEGAAALLAAAHQGGAAP